MNSREYYIIYHWVCVVLNESILKYHFWKKFGDAKLHNDLSPKEKSIFVSDKKKEKSYAFP